jgi:hypothetical protein
VLLAELIEGNEHLKHEFLVLFICRKILDVTEVEVAHEPILVAFLNFLSFWAVELVLAKICYPLRLLINTGVWVNQTERKTKVFDRRT